MVYDQAQSARLGQRVPVENTFVQSYDVDPVNDVPDLLEAAWPGMLIHRADLGILMIYNAKSGAWESIGSGPGGVSVYVSDEMPTGGSYNEGDQWYDSNDGMKAYVWNGVGWVQPGGGFTGVHIFRQPSIPTSTGTGDIWYDSDDGDKEYRAEATGISFIGNPGDGGWTRIRDTTAQGTADIKTQSYYEPGFGPDDGDPDTPLPFVPIVGHTIGDIWYQTDDNNRRWFYTGDPSAANGGWVDASDPNALAALTLANQ